MGGLVHHVGILRPDGLVVHNTPARGEHISSMPEFAEGAPIHDGGVIPAAHLPILRNNLRIASRQPRQYDAINNNCEHFVTKLLGIAPISPQLQTFATIAIGVLALGLLSQ
jgi:hypothetical protein